MAESNSNTTIAALGFYSGIGDIVSLLPSLSYVRPEVKLLVYVKPNLLSQVSGLFERYSSSNVQLLPFDGTLRFGIAFLIDVFKRRFNIIVVSAHAPLEHQNAKIPLLVFAARFLSLFRLKTFGAIDESLGFLFSNSYASSRNEKLLLRESKALFYPEITTHIVDKFPQAENKPRTRDVFMHYGASYRNKLLSRELFLRLAEKLATMYCVSISALQEDAVFFQSRLKDKVEYVEGSVSDLADIIDDSKVVLTHDTGIGHLAALKGRPLLMFFGPTNPSTYSPASNTMLVYTNNDKRFSSCMPCGAKACRRSDNLHCLTDVDFDILIDSCMNYLLEHIRPSAE